VTRGGSTSTFAVYSTTLGSPVADTSGGTVRFTCNADQVPCFVAVKAAALSDDSGTVVFKPRVSIARDGTSVSAPQPHQRFYCEYADGVGGLTGFATLTKQPKSATPTYEPVPLDIGGSADCFAAPAPGGVVDRIEVPEGFFQVDTSFVFRGQAN